MVKLNYVENLVVLLKLFFHFFPSLTVLSGWHWQYGTDPFKPSRASRVIYVTHNFSKISFHP